MAKNDDTMFIGEALIGDGDELAHVDLLIGRKRRSCRKRFC